MSIENMDLSGFSEALASGAPTPGGGGASAIVGALGAALAAMVCNLTVGRNKYREHWNEIEILLSEAESLRARLVSLADEDAAAFEPLSKAYAIPKDEPGRAEILEKCLKDAAEPPMEMLRLACKGIRLHRRIEEIGSRMALSDVGTGVVFCLAAMYGAAMNVRVNTALMTDRAYAESLNRQAESLMEENRQVAERVYISVWEKLK